MPLPERVKYNLQGYGHPTDNRPQWYVGYLTFQSGNPRLKRSSLTGGGQVVPKTWYGTFKPVIVVHTGPTTSYVGGGFVPEQMPFIMKLLANPSGSNSGT